MKLCLEPNLACLGLLQVKRITSRVEEVISNTTNSKHGKQTLCCEIAWTEGKTEPVIIDLAKYSLPECHFN